MLSLIYQVNRIIVFCSIFFFLIIDKSQPFSILIKRVSIETFSWGFGRKKTTTFLYLRLCYLLIASVFGELWRLEPLSLEKKTMWRREMNWLLSVADHIVELVPSRHSLPNGGNVEVMILLFSLFDICSNLNVALYIIILSIGIINYLKLFSFVGHHISIWSPLIPLYIFSGDGYKA